MRLRSHKLKWILVMVATIISASDATRTRQARQLQSQLPNNYSVFVRALPQDQQGNQGQSSSSSSSSSSTQQQPSPQISSDRRQNNPIRFAPQFGQQAQPQFTVRVQPQHQLQQPAVPPFQQSHSYAPLQQQHFTAQQYPQTVLTQGQPYEAIQPQQQFQPQLRHFPQHQPPIPPQQQNFNQYSFAQGGGFNFQQQAHTTTTTTTAAPPTLPPTTLPPLLFAPPPASRQSVSVSSSSSSSSSEDAIRQGKIIGSARPPAQVIQQAPASEIQFDKKSEAKDKDAAKDKDEYVVYYYYYYDDDKNNLTSTLNFDDVPNLETFDQSKKQKTPTVTAETSSSNNAVPGKTITGVSSLIDPLSRQPLPPHGGIPLDPVVTNAPQSVSVSVSVSEGSQSIGPVGQPGDAKLNFGPPPFDQNGGRPFGEGSFVSPPSGVSFETKQPTSSSLETPDSTPSTPANVETQGEGVNEILAKKEESTQETTTEVPTTTAAPTTTTEEATTTTERNRRPLFGNRKRFGGNRLPAVRKTTTTTTTPSSATTERRTNFRARPRPTRPRPGFGGRRTKEDHQEEEETVEEERVVTTPETTTTTKKRFGSGGRKFGGSPRTSGRVRTTTTTTSTTQAPKRDTISSEASPRIRGGLFNSNRLRQRQRPPFLRNRGGFKKVEEEPKKEDEEAEESTTQAREESVTSPPVQADEPTVAAEETIQEDAAEDATEAPTTTPASRTRFQPRQRPPLFGNRPRPNILNRNRSR